MSLNSIFSVVGTPNREPGEDVCDDCGEFSSIVEVSRAKSTNKRTKRREGFKFAFRLCSKCACELASSMLYFVGRRDIWERKAREDAATVERIMNTPIPCTDERCE